MSITAYFTLDRFRISLRDCGIVTSDAKKTMGAGTQMWNSKMFTEDQMLLWENKPAIDQTWPNLQTYFTKKIARTEAVFSNNGQAIPLQESSTICPGNSCCGRGR